MTNSEQDMTHKVTARAYARAGLLGNPSDGYGGKTISLVIQNYFAQVTLVPNAKISILAENEPLANATSAVDFHQRTLQFGYYGSHRLVIAAIKRFVDFFPTEPALHTKPFELRVESNIPWQVGLAGSSAIIVATLRGLLKWFELEIPRHLLASLALSVERDELGIPAGLQDRVAQVYEELVYMDFSPAAMREERGLAYGSYEPLRNVVLPNLYVAHSNVASEPTEVVHNDLRKRFQLGERRVLQAIERWAALAAEGREAILGGDWPRLAQLIDANFDIRREVCNLNSRHVAMVETARNVGCCAKYCGSGGAIIGICNDESQFGRLRSALEAIDCTVIRPDVNTPRENAAHIAL